MAYQVEFCIDLIIGERRIEVSKVIELPFVPVVGMEFIGVFGYAFNYIFDGKYKYGYEFTNPEIEGLSYDVPNSKFLACGGGYPIESRGVTPEDLIRRFFDMGCRVDDNDSWEEFAASENEDDS